MGYWIFPLPCSHDILYVTMAFNTLEYRLVFMTASSQSHQDHPCWKELFPFTALAPQRDNWHTFFKCLLTNILRDGNVFLDKLHEGRICHSPKHKALLIKAIQIFVQWINSEEQFSDRKKSNKFVQDRESDKNASSCSKWINSWLLIRWTVCIYRLVEIVKLL